jgi:hypothetical protein
MGVKATSMGHATYDVRPQMGDLTRINGTAATSRGQVSLDLHKDTAGKMNWTVTPLFCKNRNTITNLYPSLTRFLFYQTRLMPHSTFLLKPTSLQSTARTSLPLAERQICPGVWRLSPRTRPTTPSRFTWSARPSLTSWYSCESLPHAIHQARSIGLIGLEGWKGQFFKDLVSYTR